MRYVDSLSVAEDSEVVMDNSLPARLQRAEQEKARARECYASFKKRLSVAKEDAAFFHDQALLAGTQAGFIERVCGEMWLALINSGLSHRRVLRFVKQCEAEHEQ